MGLKDFIMNMTGKKVSIVICVYNRKDFIKKCLESVLSQTYQHTSIIVIDDGSNDGTAEILESFKENEKIHIHRNVQNLGLMVSRNLGAAMTDSEIVAYLDSDCIAEPNWLEELIKPFTESNDIVITGGKINDPSPCNYWQIVMLGNNFLAHKSGYIHKIIGCNMAFRRTFLLNNRFDETLKYGGDETDLCMRVCTTGLKIYYQDSAKVTHHHRNRFASLAKQRFLTGVGNYYVRLKNGVFPFVSIKSLVLLVGCLFLALGPIFSSTFYWAGIFFFLYAGRVLFENYRPKRKSLVELVFSFPGKLLLTIIEDMGYIYGIFYVAGLKLGSHKS